MSIKNIDYFWIIFIVVLSGLILFGQPSLLINGLLLGFIYSLGAIGLTLVFGILRFGNFSQGDLMTLGGYISLSIVTVIFAGIGFTGSALGPFTFGLPIILAIPLTMILTSIIVVALDQLIYKRLRTRQASTMLISIASLGVAIMIRGLVQFLWGNEPAYFPRESKQFYMLPLDIRIPPDNIILGLMAVLMTIGVYLFLKYNKYGKFMRATANNPNLSLSTGINTSIVIMWTWIISGSLAAAGGTMLAVSQAQILPMTGWKILLPIFASVILGGIGKPIGALVGAIIIGVSMEASTAWLNPTYKPAVAFTIMIAMLLVKPNGLFGEKD